MQSEPQCQLIVNLNSWTNLQGFTSQCAVATSIYNSLISGINKWCIHRNMKRGLTSCKRVNFRILQVLFCILNGNLQKVECMRAHFLCRRIFLYFFLPISCSSDCWFYSMCIFVEVEVTKVVVGGKTTKTAWIIQDQCIWLLIAHARYSSSILFEAEENKRKHSMLVHECFCVLWRHVVR